MGNNLGGETRTTTRSRKISFDDPRAYVPDESVIVELGESVGQVVKRDRRNFLKIVIFEKRVLDQPVCRPRVRFRQIKIVLSVIQHLNKRTQGTEEKKMNTYFIILSFDRKRANGKVVEWTFFFPHLPGRWSFRICTISSQDCWALQACLAIYWAPSLSRIRADLAAQTSVARLIVALCHVLARVLVRARMLKDVGEEGGGGGGGEGLKARQTGVNRAQR